MPTHSLVVMIMLCIISSNLYVAMAEVNEIVIENIKVRTQSDTYMCYNANMKKYRE